MSRSGYSTEDDDQRATILWRGAVKQAIRGKRGQAFLREMLAALDALPEQKLIAGDLECDGAVCAIGAVGKARGLAMAELDPEDRESVAAAFGISFALACEIFFENDEGSWSTVPVWSTEAPEARYRRVREWVKSNILEAI